MNLRDYLESVVRIYRESIVVLTVSLGAGVFAGGVLGTEQMTRGFETYPGLLFLLPAFLATKGNVYGSMGARIASGLHLGLLEPRFERNRRLVNVVVATAFNGIAIPVFIAVLAWGILAVLGHESARLVELVGIMLIAGTLASLVLVFGTIALLFVGYRRGQDPDNLIGPIVTTLGDVFGVLFLYVAIVVVEVYV